MVEKFDLKSFPTSESAKRMMNCVTDGFYDRSYVGKWMYQVMGMEYDMALKAIEELPLQFFPETATWGLIYHEIKWGLPVRTNLSYEERRRLIYQKRDTSAPMTPYRMERYLEELTGLNVHVADVHDLGRYSNEFEHPNMFSVTITGNSSLNLSEIRQIIDKHKQSHTVYTLHLLENYYDVNHCTYGIIVPQTKKTYEVEVL